MNAQRRLVLIYGSPTPPGRTASVLNYIEKEVNSKFPEVKTDILMPSPYKSGSIMYWEESVLEKVEHASALIVASPVYRASFPAILKQLLDELPVRALRSKPVALIAVGNVTEHYLGVERHFTDILSWFGALYVPATCYITAPSLNDGIPEKEEEQINELVESTLYLESKLHDKKLGPMPLAEAYGR